MSSYAGMIDHTALKAETTKEQIEKLCREAIQHKFCSVCVNPCWIPLCAEMLKGSGVKVCTVIGFPLGANDPEVKAFEAAKAVDKGADEVDMVIAIGHMKDGDYQFVQDDIAGVVRASKEAGAKKNVDVVVKVIFETCLLNKDDIKTACELSKAAGADFVKTSTGFSTGGATAEDIALMRATVGPDMGVKASGGVRDYAGAKAMVDAGANRIGCSAGVAIVGGGGAAGDGY